MNHGRFVPDVLINLLDDHAKLALLEWRYENERFLKRACVIAAGVVLALTAYCFLQIAVVESLRNSGWSLIHISIGLAIVNGVLGGLLISKLGHRDPRAGRPFQGTVEEWDKNLKWIQRFFF